jgi:hypothetical protein
MLPAGASHRHKGSSRPHPVNKPPDRQDDGPEIEGVETEIAGLEFRSQRLLNQTLMRFPRLKVPVEPPCQLAPWQTPVANN